MKRTLFILLALLPALMFGQKKYKDYQIQEVKKSDLDNKNFKDHPSSRSRIIFDLGEINFKRDGETYSITHSRKLRVKLLNDSSITAHQLGLTAFDNDEVTSVMHYSLSGSKVESKEISSYWSNIDKYSPLMPQIEELGSGNILEFNCLESIGSPDQVPGWQFEYEIPVDYSELRAQVPAMFKYKPIFKGYIELDLNENELLKDDSGTWIEENGFFIHQYRILAEEIPPFSTFPFSPASKNFLTSVDFYLEKIESYGSKKERKGKSWEGVSAQLNRDERIGGRIKNFDAKPIINSLGLDSNLERSVIVCYFWVKQKLTWNQEIGIYAERSLDEVLESGEGSIAEINLVLCALLNELDAVSSPALIRTVDQGDLNMEFPAANQFNYLIAWIDLNGLSLNLDATEDCLEIGFLRPSCVNAKALKINSRFEEWVELDNKEQSKNRVVCQSYLDGTSLHGDVVITRNNVFAYQNCFNFDDVKELVKMSDKLEVSTVELSRKDSIINGNKIKFHVIADEYVEKSGNVYSFRPFWFDVIDLMPFDAKERNIPIVFPYLFEYSWTYSFSYKDKEAAIASVPKSTEISTPENSMRFLYDVKELDGLLQVTAQISILTRHYPVRAYEPIQDFFKDVNKVMQEEVKIRVKNQ